MNPPWWMEGVSFQCQPDCGRCCDEPGGIVYLAKEDAVRLAEHHSLGVKEWLERDCHTTLDGRFILDSDAETDICIYLDSNKKCSVYDARPDQCRAYPWWIENLASQRTWSKTMDECPGIEAEDAFVIDGQIIRMHVMADRNASRGFRRWNEV
ncbi:MAG: YkgJ family cysteine cluster protein [Candidatus Poseidoniales archaeon]|jgi:Fe-S-cluster containining protein